MPPSYKEDNGSSCSGGDSSSSCCSHSVGSSLAATVVAIDEGKKDRSNPRQGRFGRSGSCSSSSDDNGGGCIVDSRAAQQSCSWRSRRSGGESSVEYRPLQAPMQLCAH